MALSMTMCCLPTWYNIVNKNHNYKIQMLTRLWYVPSLTMSVPLSMGAESCQAGSHIMALAKPMTLILMYSLWQCQCHWQWYNNLISKLQAAASAADPFSSFWWTFCGCAACAVLMDWLHDRPAMPISAVGPIETMVLAAGVQLSRPGGQGVGCS